jgi:hypothetical protein
MSALPKAFEDKPKEIALDRLLPTKALPETVGEIQSRSWRRTPWPI